MIDRTTIRDFYGKIIGYADLDTVTGEKTVRTFLMQIVGYYDPRENLTRTFLRQIVGEGDLTYMLLQQELDKQK